MADEKKGGSSESGGGNNPFTDALFWILFALVLWYVIKMFLGLFDFSFSVPNFSSTFVSLFNGLQIVSIFLCLVFILGIIYSKFKLGQLLHHDHHGHGHEHSHGEHSHDTGHGHESHNVQNVSNKRWETVLKRMDSVNESDWRLAIIECDILLSEMLTKMGYQGESVADKLKRVEKSDFETIEDAWSAHKIRNNIAHSGSEYHLSRSEAEDALKKYKRVFEEFFFI